MAITISRLTREFIFWDIDTGDGPVDLEQSVVEVAFISNAENRPIEDDWNTAELVQVTTTMGLAWRVRILVGPDHIDAIDLTPPTSELEDYQAWVRITDNPERPVRKSGLITVE